jgi:hypothetical protein
MLAGSNAVKERDVVVRYACERQFHGRIVVEVFNGSIKNRKVDLV